MRDYKKEAKRNKERYDEIRANIDKQLGQELRKKLKLEHKTIAGWVKENAKYYIRKVEK